MTDFFFLIYFSFYFFNTVGQDDRDKSLARPLITIYIIDLLSSSKSNLTLPEINQI